MESTLLYSQDFCKIIYNSTGNYLNVQWNGFPRNNDFRDACMKVLDFIKEYKTGKLLTDNRNAKVFSVDDQKWLNNEWLQQAIKAGYYCSETLINNDVFVKTAIRNITNKRDQNNMQTKMFTNEYEAINWLASQ